MIKKLTKEMLDYCYGEYKYVAQDETASKYAFLADGICGLITYDCELDETFGRAIAEVMIAIRDRNQTEYFSQSRIKYAEFVIVCNLFARLKWIEWGVSIRHPFFNRAAFGNLCKLDIPIDSPYYDSDGVEFNDENAKILLDWLEKTE